MIKIVGNDLWRGGEKIGWMEGNHIKDHEGKKLGYFEDRYVYGVDGHKLAYVEGDHLVAYGGSESKVPLDQIMENIEGGVLPELGKCAIYVLLGD